MMKVKIDAGELDEVNLAARCDYEVYPCVKDRLERNETMVLEERRAEKEAEERQKKEEEESRKKLCSEMREAYEEDDEECEKMCMNKQDHKPKPMEDEDDEREERIRKGWMVPCKCTFHDLTHEERKRIREQSKSVKDAYRDNSSLSTTDLKEAGKR